MTEPTSNVETFGIEIIGVNEPSQTGVEFTEETEFGDALQLHIDELSDVNGATGNLASQQREQLRLRIARELGPMILECRLQLLLDQHQRLGMLSFSGVLNHLQK